MRVRSRTSARALLERAHPLFSPGIASLLALGACNEDHEAPGAAAPADSGSQLPEAAISPLADAATGEPQVATSVAPDAGSADAALHLQLAGEFVRAGSIARIVLYSWTSAAQVEELRANPLLLTRSESSTHGPTRLSTVLSSLAMRGDTLAQRLTSPELQKGRYAWVNAWANCRGWPGESYGDQLLRIVLKPEALVVILRGHALSVVDMQNRQVETASALAQPERIGAVYFVNEGAAIQGACGSFADCPTGGYREYFVNNERMIEEWSLGTEAIRDEIERSSRVVEALRDWTAQSQTAIGSCSFASSAVCRWLDAAPIVVSSSNNTSNPWDDYNMALALTSDYYAPTQENMSALFDTLRANLFTPNPLVHRP